MGSLFAFITGLMFGLGLIVSGLVNPAKILGFLDITGKWDPSLALVMAGLGWAYDARLIRSVALGLRTREFTETAIFSGMFTDWVRVVDDAAA